MFNLTILINQDSYQVLTRLGIPCAIVVGTDITPLVHTDAKDYLITSVRRIQKTSDPYGFFNGVTFNPETNVIVFFFEGSKLQHDISDASKLEDLIHVLKFYTNLLAIGLSIDEINWKKTFMRRIINVLYNYKRLAFN